MMSVDDFVLSVSTENSSEAMVVSSGLDDRELRLPRPLFCAAKPIVALAAIGLLDESSGDDPLSLRVGLDGFVGTSEGWELRGLLHHEYPELAHPTLMRLHITEPSRREDLLRRLVEVAGTRRGPAVYSEVASWWLIERAIGSVRRPNRWPSELQQHLRRETSSDEIWAWPDRALMSLHPTEIGHSFFLEDDGHLAPLVHETSRRTRMLTSPGLGLFGSAQFLHAWYRRLGEIMSRGGSGHVLWGGAAAKLWLQSLAHSEPRGRYLVGFQAKWPGLDRPVVGHIAAGGTVGAGLALDTGASFAFVGRAYIDSPKQRLTVLRKILASFLRTEASVS